MGLQLSGSVQLEGNLLVTGSANVSGSLGIGTTTSAVLFTLGKIGTANQLGFYDGATAKGFIGIAAGTSDIIATDALNDMVIRPSASGNLLFAIGATERMRVASTGDGNVTVSTGNLVIGTAGKGIDFSITSNGSGTTTSELLNDYEEGTWTPTFTASTSGTITVDTTVGYTAARYTKIGRQVTVSGTFTVLSVSSPVGEWRIQGLPFTSEAGAAKRSAVSVFADGLETTATTSIIGYIDPNVTYITLYKYAAGGNSPMAADVKAGSYIFLTATYNV